MSVWVAVAIMKMYLQIVYEIIFVGHFSQNLKFRKD